MSNHKCQAKRIKGKSVYGEMEYIRRKLLELQDQFMYLRFYNSYADYEYLRIAGKIQKKKN